MTVRVALAPMLGERIGGRSAVHIDGTTVAEVLRTLGERFPDLNPLLWNAKGEFNSFLVVFLNDQDVRELEGLDTGLRAGDELSIISALEGG